MPATGQAIVIVMPTEEETELVEKIREAISKLANYWHYMVGWVFILGVTSLLLLGHLNRRGRDDFFFKWASEEASITALLVAFVVLSVVWTTVVYFFYFRQRRCQKVAELEQLTQDPAVWTAVEKLRRIKEVVGPLERFDPVLDRLQRPDRFTRRHLRSLLAVRT